MVKLRKLSKYLILLLTLAFISSTKAERELDEFTEILRKATADIDTAKTNITILRQELSKIRENFKELEDSLKLKATTKAFEDSVRNIRGKLNGLEATITSIKETLSKTEENLTKLSGPRESIEGETVSILGYTLRATDFKRIDSVEIWIHTTHQTFLDTSTDNGFFRMDLPIRLNEFISIDALKPGFQFDPCSLTVEKSFSMLKLYLVPEPQTKKIEVKILRAPSTASQFVRWQPLPDRTLKITWKTSWETIEQSYPPADSSGSVKSVELPPADEGVTVNYEVWFEERLEGEGIIHYNEISKEDVLKILVTPK